MVVSEREKHVHGRMYQYQAYKYELGEYLYCASGGTRHMDATGVRGSFLSDPTARGGVMLAQLPERLQEKARWCLAIEDAWAECVTEDEGDPRGLAYLMERNFCLTGAPRPKEKNRESRLSICAESRIAESTFYARLDRITDIMIYHAASHGLI